MSILTIIGAWFCTIAGLTALAGLTYFIAWLNFKAFIALITKVSDWKTFCEFSEWKQLQDKNAGGSDEQAGHENN